VLQILQIKTRFSNMIIVLKVILMILIHKTYAYIKQDSEIILLPAWNPTGLDEVRAFHYTFLFNAQRLNYY